MQIRRVVPNIKSDQVEKNQAFYEDVLGFEKVMQLDWIATFAAPGQPTAQISVFYDQEPSGILPDISIEVEDVDAIHSRAVAQGVKIVYPLTDEPWGVRRFFAVDPNGQVINIVSHQ